MAGESHRDDYDRGLKKSKKTKLKKSKMVKSVKKKKGKKAKKGKKGKKGKKKKKSMTEVPTASPSAIPTISSSMGDPTGAPGLNDDEYSVSSTSTSAPTSLVEIEFTQDPPPPSLENGLELKNLERAYKMSAAAHLSKAGPDFTPVPGMTLEFIADMKAAFSPDAIFIQYAENRTIGVDDGLLVKDNGQCFFTLQATTNDIGDILDNANRGVKDVCNKDGICCPFRAGYVDAWNNDFKDELLADTKECVEACDPYSDEPCLLIGGHSQGGALANTAFLELKDLTDDYESYTFGAPASLMVQAEDCSPFEPNKFFRFGKGVYKSGGGGGAAGVAFDWVPTIDLRFSGGETAYHIGPYIVLSSEDSSNIAYIGMNSNVITLRPFDKLPAPFGLAHFMYTDDNSGYFNLLKLMIAEAEAFPIPINGFDDGMHCSPRTEFQSDLLCSSGRCDRARFEVHPTCKSLLDKGEGCNSDEDCKSGSCVRKGFFGKECE